MFENVTGEIDLAPDRDDHFVELEPARLLRIGAPRRWRPYLYASVLHSTTVFVLASLVQASDPHCEPLRHSGLAAFMGPLACLLPIGRCAPLQQLSLATAAGVIGIVLCCHAWLLRWTGWTVSVSLLGWFLWLSWGCFSGLAGI